MTRGPRTAAYPGDDWRTYRLSPHFVAGEFFRDGSEAPPWGQVAAVRSLCREVLEPLRQRFGACIVFSGHRTRVRNREVGGAENSFHIYDEHPGIAAADVGFRTGQPGAWYAAAEPLCEHHGLGKYPTHIHVDNRPYRARW